MIRDFGLSPVTLRLVGVDNVLWLFGWGNVWHVVAGLLDGVVSLFVVALVSVLAELVDEGSVEDVLQEVGVVVVSDVVVSWPVVVVAVLRVGLGVGVVVGGLVKVAAVGVSVAEFAVGPAEGVSLSVLGGALVSWVVADV